VQRLERFRKWWATASSSVTVHRRAKWFWVALIPFSYVARDSVAWVTFMSHYAIVTGHWSSEEAAMSAAMPDGRDIQQVVAELEAKIDRLMAHLGVPDTDT
jgi:hypothetical protein